jgi:predicted amidohydrolase
MKIALVSNLITLDIDHNLNDIISTCHQVAKKGVDLVLFPEMAITGMINNDDPDHDLPLGMELAHPIISRLKRLAGDLDLWVAIGILEREGGHLYDSAILITHLGEIALHHRRISPRWHGAKADPAIYYQATAVKYADTPLGRIIFLICGDLFDDDAVSQIPSLNPDYILYPFARSFEDGTIDQQRWDNIEMPEYSKRIRGLGIPTFMAGYIGTELTDDASFGGAFAIDKDGTLLAGHPLGKSGILFINIAG